jgi:hypothetical protein
MLRALALSAAALLSSLAAAQEFPEPTAWVAETPGVALVTGGASLTIGVGQPPLVLVEGPIYITQLTSDWPMYFALESPVEPYWVTVNFAPGLFVPAGVALVAVDGFGFAHATIAWSGYRPSPS